MNKKEYFVYILTNYTKTTLYIGVTRNLKHRIWEHKAKSNKGFSEKYNSNYLIYYETYKYIEDAIFREKCIKKWNRKWKEKLISKTNPTWQDLSIDWYN